MVAWLAPIVQAQAAASATGTWKWTQAGFGGGRGRGGGGGPAAQPGGPGGPGGAPATQPGGAPGARGGGGGRGGQPTEITATLKQDGEKLTGQVIGMDFQDPTAKSDIKEGSVKADGTVAFKVTMTMGGQFEITRTFTGKLSGDTITGTASIEPPAGGFGGGPGGPGGAAPGGRGPASQPGAGAPGGRGPGGGGGGGFMQPQEWTATRQKAS